MHPEPSHRPPQARRPVRRRLAALLTSLVIVGSIGSAWTQPSGATEATRTLRINQVDQGGTTVTGGCYSLFIGPAANDDLWGNSCDSFDDAGNDGIVLFTDLPPGVYEAVEYDAPNGYRVNDTPVPADLTTSNVEATQPHVPGPKLTVRVEDSHGALVPGTCVYITDVDSSEARYGEECDGDGWGPFEGDGAPDGIVVFDEIPEADLSVGVFNVPAGYTAPDARVPFTMTDEDTGVTVVLEGGTVDPRDCTVFGTEDDDVLYGTSASDVICGLGGDDVIWAGKGADVVYGDEGNDVLHGQAGRDALHGGPDDDRVDGGGDKDTAACGTGTDGWKTVEARTSCEYRW